MQTDGSGAQNPADHILINTHNRSLRRVAASQPDGRREFTNRLLG